MAVFDVFWDCAARVVLAVCNLDDLQLEEAVILAERSCPDGHFVNCGIFEVKLAQSGLSDVIVISIPVAENGPVNLRLDVVGTGYLSGEIVRKSESLIMLEKHAASPVLAQTSKWSVAGSELGIVIEDGHDAAPDDRVSKVYVSPREGANVYPAVLGESEGEGAVLSLSVEMLGSIDEPDDPDRAMLGVTLATVDGEHAMNTHVTCYTLSAAHHVLPLLRDDGKMRLPKTDNKFSGELRPNAARAVTLQFVAGRDNPASWKGYVVSKGEPIRLDLLDRVVVETSPPATFIHADAVGNTHRVGKKGVAVLAMGPTGIWHADNGRLIDRILADEASFSPFMPSTFTSDLSQQGFSVNASDLEGASEIVAFAYAAILRQIREELGAMARQVEPRSCKAFCANAEDYCAISLLPAERISRRSLLTVSRELQNAQRADAVRHLAIGMLEMGPKDRNGLLSIWARSEQVNGWAVLAAAIDPTIRDAAKAGLLMDSSNIVMFMRDRESDFAQEFQSMAKQVHTLVAAGIFSADADDVLEHVTEIDGRAGRLEALRKNAIAAVSSVNRKLGPFEGMPVALAGFLGALGQIVEDDDAAGPDRVTRFFAEHAQQMLENINGSKPAPEFFEKLGRFLRQSIDEDAHNVERLVSAGLSDPITLKSDKIVSMGLSEGPQAGFVAATVDESMVAWMNSEAPGPAIVAQWRRELRHIHDERKQRRITPGS